METVTGEAPRGDYLTDALTGTVNRVASLSWGRALWTALLLGIALALIGVCLFALVVTVKVFKMGAGQVLTPAPGPHREPFVMQAGG